MVSSTMRVIRILNGRWEVMCDEFKELKEYIERFDKVLENLSKGDGTEDDNEFINCYHLHLAIAIISSIGDDNAKKVAKMILAQVE